MGKKIVAVAGTGYVGLANAVLLALNNKVYAVDVVNKVYNRDLFYRD